MQEQLIVGDGSRQGAGPGGGMRRTASGSEVLVAALKDTARADNEANIPVERMHGLVDALFPIVATVLFAKNFSEIEEAEGELMIEVCTEVHTDMESDECTWPEIARLMWWGSHGNHQRFDRLASTCAVFCLVYLDWAANVRVFRNLEHVSKLSMLVQMLWCIGGTIYPITLSPWMMGWESTLGMRLAIGQLAYCQLIHTLLTCLLPLKKSVRNMLLAEDVGMVVGLGIMGVIVEITDHRSTYVYQAQNAPSYYWMMFLVLHACRIVLQRRLSSSEDFSLPPWAVKLGRLEFFTDGICEWPLCAFEILF